MTGEIAEAKEAAEEPQGVAVEPVKPVEEQTVDVSDVDASWDGTGTLDAHRQKAFAKLKQPGFGNIGKVNADGE